MAPSSMPKKIKEAARFRRWLAGADVSPGGSKGVRAEGIGGMSRRAMRMRRQAMDGKQMALHSGEPSAQRPPAQRSLRACRPQVFQLWENDDE